MSNSTRPTVTTGSGSAGAEAYDERFVVPLEASRRGAHRARSSPVMAMLPVAAVVGIVIGAIVLVYLFLGGMSNSDSGTRAVTTASPTAAASSSAAVAAAPSSSASGSATAGASDTTVDHTLTVAVYNDTGTSGLAKKAATKVAAAGWKLGVVGTWTGSPVSVSTVFYASEAQHATAQAVATALGHAATKLSASKAAAGLVAVIGPDYPGAGVHPPAPGPRHNTTSKTVTPAASDPAAQTPAASPDPTATGSAPAGDTAAPTP